MSGKIPKKGSTPGGNPQLPTAPKRVAGGALLRLGSGGGIGKKKKQKIRNSSPKTSATKTATLTKTIRSREKLGISIVATTNQRDQLEKKQQSSGIPSILTSLPKQTSFSSTEVATKTSNEGEEFDDDILFDFDEQDVPSDAFLCLQSYTRSQSSFMSETCAYCPIFTHSTGDTIRKNTNCGDIMDATASSNSDTTQKMSFAAPFLPRHVLFHLLDLNPSPTSAGDIATSMSSRSHTDQELKRLATTNKIRLLQLHGTSIARSRGNLCRFSNGGAGPRGDGNDDDDIAIMETSAYVAAAEMALNLHFGQPEENSKILQELKPKATTSPQIRMLPKSSFHQNPLSNKHAQSHSIFQWFTLSLLPNFAGRTWISSSALDTFLQSMNMTKKSALIMSGSPSKLNYWTMKELTFMIEKLVHAGLLLPRRGLGLSGDDGYWFSLPGLGQAAKSIADGRISILRRIQLSRYKEKKRSVLEQDYGNDHKNEISHLGEDEQSSKWNNTKKKDVFQQSGKFLVMDLIAKGWVVVHKTCGEEQFIRFSDVA